jgi:hypothetical protein
VTKTDTPHTNEIETERNGDVLLQLKLDPASPCTHESDRSKNSELLEMKNGSRELEQGNSTEKTGGLELGPSPGRL